MSKFKVAFDNLKRWVLPCARKLASSAFALAVLLTGFDASASNFNLGTISGSVSKSGSLVAGDKVSDFGLVKYVDVYTFSPTADGTMLITGWTCSGTTTYLDVIALRDERFSYNVGTKSGNVRKGYEYSIKVYNYSGTGQTYSFTLNVPGAAAPTTYAVTYNPGSYSSGSTYTATKYKGQNLTLKGATYTRSGYTQKGWSTSTYGTSRAYTLGDTYAADAATTLYPYWEKNSVSRPDLAFYQPSGWGDKLVVSTTTGTSSDASSISVGDSVYLDFAVKNVGNASSDSVYVDIYVDGEKVDYWPYVQGLAAGEYHSWTDRYIGTLSAGSHQIEVRIRNDESETVTSNNSYSKWITVIASTCTVRFDAGGGTGSKASEHVSSGTYYTLPACPFTRTDYVFDGWNVTSCCTEYENPMSSGRIVRVEEDITLTATWRYSPPARPSNDNFSQASYIFGSSASVAGNNCNATSQAGEPMLKFKSSATTTVWWRWTAPGNGSVQIDTIGTGFDTVLGVYVGSSLTSLVKAGAEGENDDGGGNLTSKCVVECVEGTTYYICVAGYGGSAGAIALHLNFTEVQAKPDIDLICTRFDLWENKPIIVHHGEEFSLDEEVFSDEDIYVQVSVRNTGADAAKNFHVSLTLDGVKVRDYLVGELSPMAEEVYLYDEHYQLTGTTLSIFSINIGRLSVGSHTLVLMADSGFDIEETDETNNSYTKRFDVGERRQEPVDGVLTCTGATNDFGGQELPVVVQGTCPGSSERLEFSFVPDVSLDSLVWMDSDETWCRYLTATLSGNGESATLTKTDCVRFSFSKGVKYTVSIRQEYYSSVRAHDDLSFKVQLGGWLSLIPYIGRPTSVTASATGAGVSVSWAAVEGATSYHVYRKWEKLSGEQKTGGSLLDNKIAEVAGDRTQYVDADIDSSDSFRYYYYVRAVNDSAVGRFSERSDGVIPVRDAVAVVGSVTAVPGGIGGTSYLMTLEGSGSMFVVDGTWFSASGIDVAGGVTPALMNGVGRNGIPRYQSFLFGLEPESPTPAADQLRTTIAMGDDGLPVVSCIPRKESSLVSYTTLGKPSLDSEQWVEVTDANRASMRYFRVKVGLR